MTNRIEGEDIVAIIVASIFPLSVIAWILDSLWGC